MRNAIIEEHINSACICPLDKRDFTEQEMRYIVEHQSFKDDLLFWFESSHSDGCWTEQNFSYMRSFYPQMLIRENLDALTEDITF